MHQVVYSPYGAWVDMTQDGISFRIEMQMHVQADTRSLLKRQTIRSLEEEKLQPQLFVAVDSRGLPCQPVLLPQQHEVYDVTVELSWTEQVCSFVGWGPLQAPWIYDPVFDWDTRIKKVVEGVAVKLFPTAQCESVFVYTGGIVIAYDTDELRRSDQLAHLAPPPPAMQGLPLSVAA